MLNAFIELVDQILGWAVLAQLLLLILIPLARMHRDANKEQEFQSVLNVLKDMREQEGQ